MSRLLSVENTRRAFYENVEQKDVENMANYFETLYLHYQERGRKLKDYKKRS